MFWFLFCFSQTGPVVFSMASVRSTGSMASSIRLFQGYIPSRNDSMTNRGPFCQQKKRRKKPNCWLSFVWIFDLLLSERSDRHGWLVLRSSVDLRQYRKLRAYEVHVTAFQQNRKPQTATSNFCTSFRSPLFVNWLFWVCGSGEFLRKLRSGSASWHFIKESIRLPRIPGAVSDAKLPFGLALSMVFWTDFYGIIFGSHHYLA